MRRKLLLLAAPLACLAFVACSLLFFGREHLARVPVPFFLQHGEHQDDATAYSSARVPVVAPVPDGTILPAANITDYLNAIFELETSRLPTLDCPSTDVTRYKSLQISRSPDSNIEYFFALNLRNNLNLLPLLVGSIVQAIRFLGPHSCALSIVEGNSPDGTADVLSALRGGLESLGATFYFKSSDVDPSKKDRIARLAQLRNLALQPLVESKDRTTRDTSVIFLNDVSACTEDILELVYQRKNLGADMTCAMDWTYVGQDPTFYDVWIARGINGDSFFHIPPDGNWNSAWDLFWNAQDTQSRFHSQRPFQVFACWNGAAVFAAQPILEDLRFRAANTTAGECSQGEPQLFCKDMWFRGRGKIAVVPSVNLEYSVNKGQMIKLSKGFTSDIIAGQDPSEDTIDWRKEPPEKVKCMPTWKNQYWQLWDEGLKSGNGHAPRH